MSEMGHSRLRWSRPRLVHVRFNSDSDRLPTNCDPSLRANSQLMHCSKPLGLHDRWRPKETIGIADAYPEAIGFGHQEAA